MDTSGHRVCCDGACRLVRRPRYGAGGVRTAGRVAALALGSAQLNSTGSELPRTELWREELSPQVGVRSQVDLAATLPQGLRGFRPNAMRRVAGRGHLDSPTVTVVLAPSCGKAGGGGDRRNAAGLGARGAVVQTGRERRPEGFPGRMNHRSGLPVLDRGVSPEPACTQP